jgi:hypothetical protein
MNWLTTVVLLAMAYAAAFLECAFPAFRNWLGAQPDVMPALVVCAALTASGRTVIAVAVCGGLWSDALSANPLGVSILPLLAIGLPLQRWRDLLLREFSYAQFILGFVAGALAPLLTLPLLLSLDDNPLVGWRSLWQVLVLALSGGFLTPLLFRALALFEAWFAYQPVAQSAFRPDREIRRSRTPLC